MGHSIDAALTTERTFSNRLWEKVYIAYYDRVKRYAFCILKRKSEAEDVAQNTFIRVRNHLDQADDDDHGKFSRYLLQIARNLSIDQLKRDARETNLPQEGMEELMGCVPSTEDTVMHREDRRRIDAAVGELNDDWQRAVRMRYIQDYPEKQIAEKICEKAKFGNVEILKASGLNSLYASDGGIIVSYSF